MHQMFDKGKATASKMTRGTAMQPQVGCMSVVFVQNQSVRKFAGIVELWP